MHSKEKLQYLDAIYFSPHKFLGGPGSLGVLVFNKNLYKNTVPDHPGGGTVDFTNPWGEHMFVDDIEAREDGGTPAFLQTIKTSLSIKLKESMGVDKIQEREHELLSLLWERLDKVDNLYILATQHRNRLGVISFYIDNLHYNVGVKMLKDKFGIQVRGGCSCAGTYGHYLLNLDNQQSNLISSKIHEGDCSLRPGWIRMSIHPTMTNEELLSIVDGIESLAKNHQEWSKEYVIDHFNNVIKHKSVENLDPIKEHINEIFETSLV